MKKLGSALLLATSLLAGYSQAAQKEVNVYSYRQPFLVEPLFEKFTKQTGIKVNVLFANKGLTERLASEGAYSPADVILTVDISRLTNLVDQGLVQPITVAEVGENIPPQYRGEDNQWVGLTLRARGIYSSRERVGRLPADFDYLDLADPKWKGRICTRSGKHPYNVSLVAAMIAHHGEATTKTWLQGLKANLARKPQGNDRGQVKAISEGFCDLSLGNSYYLGKMANDESQKAWADAVYINFPGQQAQGTHVNVSGVALAKHAPNKANAEQLIAFLTGEAAQSMYADVNYEHPIKQGVKPSALVQSWGGSQFDALPLPQIAAHYGDAIRLLDEVQFDL